MARPREFEEDAVLETVAQCFWARGYEGTSVRDIVERTGLTGASLYNVFGDKRAMYERSLDHYVERSIMHRIRRCETLPPREAIHSFFAEILRRSLTDPAHKGCMLVNAALEVGPDHPEFQATLSKVLSKIQIFFHKAIVAGQADGSITPAQPSDQLASHLLGVLMGVRVLARVRPQKKLLEGVVAPALALLDSHLA